MIDSPAPKAPIVLVNLQDTFSFDSSSSHLGVLESYKIPEFCWQNWLTTWLKLLAPTIVDRDVCEITLRLSDDREIQQLNAKYRDLNRPTDVLAFATLEGDFPHPLTADFVDEPLYLGDLIISVETATSQAKQHKYSLRQEIIWLAAHGFLHLLGWDHPDEPSLNKMIIQQETLLQIDSIKNYHLSETNYSEITESESIASTK